jgi:hypothetical protein
LTCTFFARGLLGAVTVHEKAGSMTVTDAGLNATYKMDHWHWHWGLSDTEGSEHTVGDKRFPLEVGSRA